MRENSKLEYLLPQALDQLSDNPAKNEIVVECLYDRLLEINKSSEDSNRLIDLLSYRGNYNSMMLAVKSMDDELKRKMEISSRINSLYYEIKNPN